MRQINRFSIGDADRVAQTRAAMRGDDFNAMNFGRTAGAPLPDRAWDAFFGAIQRQGDAAQNAGMNFNVDLVGRRGSGIGTLKTQDPYAAAGQQIPLAVRGLLRATGNR